MVVLTTEDDPTHVKAMLLGADRYGKYNHIDSVKGMMVFLLPGEKPSDACERAGITAKIALEKLVEHLERTRHGIHTDD